MANLHSQLDSHQIHGGYLYKKGVYNRAWKKRYFVLFDDRTISYFEKEKHSKSRNKAKGSIHLTQISRVELVHYIDPNEFQQKSKHNFNEIVTNDTHRINPKNKYLLRQNSSKQNNYILHRQQSDSKDSTNKTKNPLFKYNYKPKKQSKSQHTNQPNTTDSTPSFTTDDINYKNILWNEKHSQNSKESKKYKFKNIINDNSTLNVINNPKKSKQIRSRTAAAPHEARFDFHKSAPIINNKSNISKQLNEKSRNSIEDIENDQDENIPELDRITSKSLPKNKNLNDIIDDMNIFSPKSIISKRTHLLSFNSHQNILSPTTPTPIYKHKPIAKKHIKRPASITMNGWAFFTPNDRKYEYGKSPTPINSHQPPKEFVKMHRTQSLSISQTSSTEEEEDDNNFFAHIRTHKRRRSSSIGDIPHIIKTKYKSRPLSAKPYKHNQNIFKQTQTQPLRPQSATFTKKNKQFQNDTNNIHINAISTEEIIISNDNDILSINSTPISMSTTQRNDNNDPFNIPLTPTSPNNNQLNDESYNQNDSSISSRTPSESITNSDKHKNENDNNNFKNVKVAITQSKSEGIEINTQRRASHLPRPPPRNSIIKSKTNIENNKLKGLLPLNDTINDDSDEVSEDSFIEIISKPVATPKGYFMTKSVPTDLHDITEQKELKMDMKKYYRKNKNKNKKKKGYRNDIIVCDNIRKFNKEKRIENDEELSQSLATQNEFSLYTSVLENTKSNLTADRRYSFALIQPNRNWILSAEKENECKKWVALFNKLVQGKHVFSGYLIKRGKNVKSWKKRYFVLFENKVLNYYHNKNINDKGALIGDIDLRHTMWLRICNINEFKSKPNIDDFFNDKQPNNNKRRSVSILSRKKNRKNKIFTLPKATTVDLNDRSGSRVHYKSFSWAKKDKEEQDKDKNKECYFFEVSTPNRKWIFCAENENIRNTWYAQIRDVFYDKLILKIYFDSPCHIEIIHMGQNLKNRYAALLKGWLIVFRDREKLNDIRQMTFFSDTIFRDYVRTKNCICIPLKNATVIQNFKSVYGQFSFEIKIQDRCWYFNVDTGEILIKWLNLLNIQQTNSDIDYSRIEQSYSNLPSITRLDSKDNNIGLSPKFWVQTDLKEEDSNDSNTEDNDDDDDDDDENENENVNVINTVTIVNKNNLKPNEINDNYKLSWNSNENENQDSMDFQHGLDTTLEDIVTPVNDKDYEHSIDFNVD